MANAREPPRVEFYYDIVCPFAYIASLRLPAIAAHVGATIIWRPVLLGAIYRATSAPQGPHKSATDVHNPARRAIGSKSFSRTLRRLGIAHLKFPAQHPIRSVDALRLLYAIPDDDAIDGGGARQAVSHALFAAYWIQGGTAIADRDALLDIAKAALRGTGVKTHAALAAGLDRAVFDDARAKHELERATADAVERGAPGVPGFWIADERWRDATSGEDKVGRLYWGQDRLHFVHASLLRAYSSPASREGASVPRLLSLLPRCRRAAGHLREPVRLEFWFDFSSPWAYLGWTTLDRLRQTYGPNLEIKLVPILLGALFRDVGAPDVPMLAMSEQKRRWGKNDMNDWERFWRAVDEQEGVLSGDKAHLPIKWATVFPIRTVTALRCAIAEPACIPAVYRACWSLDKNMSAEGVLGEVLHGAGFDPKKLLTQAKTPAVKQQLIDNTTQAKDIGLCGVPAYRVFRGSGPAQDEWKQVGGLVWGQDETAVVEDYILKWDEETPTGEIATVEAIQATEKARI